MPLPKSDAPPKSDSPSLRAPIDRLQHHFTRSHIDVNELELRMLRVKKAKTAQDIERIFADLPPLDEAPPASSPVPGQGAERPVNGRGNAPVASSRRASTSSVSTAAAIVVEPREQAALALHAPRRPETQIVSVLSSNRRDITLRDGEEGMAVAVMGEATVFVDTSQLPPNGVAELKCVAVMGHLMIYVKSGVDVEASGVGVLGYFERWGGRRRARQGPLLRITGAAVLGGVKIIVADEE